MTTLSYHGPSLTSPIDPILEHSAPLSHYHCVRDRVSSQPGNHIICGPEITLRPVEDITSCLEQSDGPLNIKELIFLSQRCSRDKSPHLAHMLYMRMCADGLEAHPAVGNYIVPMLVETRDVFEAQQVFNRLVELNEHSWTALIHGYLACGEFHHAFQIFKLMYSYHVYPSVYTFTGLVKRCADFQSLEKGWDIHAEIVKEGFEEDLYLGTILLDMYVKCGWVVEAHDVFDELPL